MKEKVYDEKTYNLLIPSTSSVQINPFFKQVMTEIKVNMDINAGEIFIAGETKAGEKNGSPIYEKVYALAKPFLMKLSTSAGIQFDPKNTYSERENTNTYVGHAFGAVRLADGTWKTQPDSKRICLDDEESNCRIRYSDNAMFGISNYYAAKDAAEKFRGKYVQTGKFKTDKRTGQQYPEEKFMIDESDREKYIERSVMIYMSQLRKTASEKAQTGAILRVIRALLGIKGGYTKKELEKPFVVQTITFSPDYTDPKVRNAMFKQGLLSVGNLFGTAPSLSYGTYANENDNIVDEVEDPEVRIDAPPIDSIYDNAADAPQEAPEQPKNEKLEEVQNQQADKKQTEKTSQQEEKKQSGQEGKISPWDVKVPDDVYSAYGQYKGMTLREAAKTAGAENLFAYLKSGYTGDERVKKAATVILDYVQNQKQKQQQ